MLRSLLLVALTACGGGPKFDAPAFCDAIADHACDAFAACGCPEEATCWDDQHAACVRSFAGYVGAAALGVLDVDADAAEACLVAYAATTGTCAAPTEQNRPRACQNIFLDRAPIGGTCDPLGVGLLCAEGAGACDGLQVCEGLASVDGACGLTARCTEGAVCDIDRCVVPGGADAACMSDVGCAEGLVCARGACATPATLGAACEAQDDCAKGLACDAGVCTDGIAQGAACPGDGCGQDAACVPTGDARACAPLGAVGDVCEAWDACASGLQCDFQQTPALCAPLPVAGEACPSGTCDATSTCVAGFCTPRAATGEACAATYLGCAEGAGCDLATGLCAPLGGEGEACLGDERACADGLLCDPFGPSGLCIAPLSEGAPCQGVIGACAAGLYCGGPALECTPIVAPGAACDAFDACGPNGMCTNGVCEALPSSDGASCVYDCAGDLRCTDAPGVCAAGVCALAAVPSAAPQ